MVERICFLRDDEFDASGIQLKKIDKEWLGTQVVYKKATPKELAARYNLKIDRIRRFARAVKKGDYPKEEGGRPPKLDQIASGNLYTWLTANRNYTIDDLREEIKTKVRDSLRRRGIEPPPVHVKVISQRGLRRYEKRFAAFANFFNESMRDLDEIIARVNDRESSKQIEFLKAIFFLMF